MPPSGTITPPRIFKTRFFGRWMRKSALTDEVLVKAVQEMLAGLVDADLGGGVVKKRIGAPGRGKRGGARTLIATNKGDRWFFMLGFMKNERNEMGEEELKKLRIYASDLLNQSSEQLCRAIEDGSLEEIFRGHKA